MADYVNGVYGPDANRRLEEDFTLTWPCYLQPGQKAVFEFSSEAAKELAFIVYNDANMANVLETGTPPYRDWNPRQLTDTGTYLVSAWQKTGVWHPATIQSVPPPPGYVAKWQVEDDQHDGDWNDIQVSVRIV